MPSSAEGPGQDPHQSPRRETIPVRPLIQRPVNGADIAISLGALLVLTAMLRPSRSKELSFDRT